MAEELRRLCACATSGGFLAFFAGGSAYIRNRSVSCTREDIRTGGAGAREANQGSNGVFTLEGYSEEVDRSG
jgi:hypothetical protein